MTQPDTGRCLNCEAVLHGAFCARCGQRAVPAYPTVNELAGDAWHELTGYDGRLARTLRGLVRPGVLTRDYLEGHRARYLSPVRLYLIVSVLYFLIAAAAPVRPGGALVEAPGGLKIGLPDRSGSPSQIMTAEEREQLRSRAHKASGVFRIFSPLFLALAEDPDAFRARILTTMPRVFFVLVPVFAAIVSAFYRGRRFPTHLVFALHLYTFVFVALMLAEAAKFTNSLPVSIIAGVIANIAAVVYALLAFRGVYGDGWVRTIGKTIGIGLLYLVSAIPVYIVMLLWAARR
jgi:hypothetical protein